jgi:Tfp pilus assembly protein PilF
MKLRTLAILGLLAVGAPSIGCGGDKKPPETANNPKPNGGGTNPKDLKPEAQKQYDAALEMFVGHDKANDWNDDACNSTAKAFDQAADLQAPKKFPEAHYNAGLAYQRCNKDNDAKGKFNKALQDEPKFHYARAQLALYQFKADNNVEAAIGALEQTVTDANFQNVPALVNLAMFQMLRDSDKIGANCKTMKDGKEAELKDFDCAKLNLQRALAIDDAYMPAFNQLALFYFNGAKKRAGAKMLGGRFGRQIATNAALGKRADVQQLELAALVCSQAIRKSAKYAPIHNPAGLIMNELGQTNTAVRHFQTASSLDPQFFEAHMNLAAVNLSFRGFDKAEAAYRKALAIPGHDNDYDARLGLALALRGQIDDANYEQQTKAVEEQLAKAKSIDANRPDYYFNMAIFTDEYKAKSGGAKDKIIAELKNAETLYKEFISKAGSQEAYAPAVKKAKDRIEDIATKIDFLNTTTEAPPTPPPAGGGDKPK